MNRQQRRAAAKSGNKDNTELEEKIALFSKMPEECLTCLKPFDKSNKEMAMTWSVVVHGEEELVRLYCPECWNKAKEITENFKKHLEEKFGRIDD
tara:strand:- start:1939 stop:2223 length:285 start_codon:yes stop_codon:yes gene_type:complete